MLVVRARCPLGSSGALVPINQRRTTMRRPTRTALRTLRTSVMLARSGDPLALPATLRRLASGQDGMATAEYAIGTLAAAAFAGLLLALMRSGSLSGALQSIIESALSV